MEEIILIVIVNRKRSASQEHKQSFAKSSSDPHLRVSTRGSSISMDAPDTECVGQGPARGPHVRCQIASTNTDELQTPTRKHGSNGLRLQSTKPSQSIVRPPSVRLPNCLPHCITTFKSPVLNVMNSVMNPCACDVAYLS